MVKKQVWVSPNSGGGWKVHKAGAKKDSVHTHNKKEALIRAKEIAKNSKAELLVQRTDGRIKQRNSYGRDPFPPRG